MTFLVVKLSFLTTFLTSDKNGCGLFFQSRGEVLAPRTLHCYRNCETKQETENQVL